MTALPAQSGDGRNSIAFSGFRIDFRGGCLCRGDQTIALRPKTWAVLVHLAERPGALVSTDELLDAVWQGIAVTPDTLRKSIGELRLALGDESKTPLYIETVHRRGFRFVAKIDQEAATERAQPDRGQTPAVPRLFVGRTTELRRLNEALARASSGERTIIFVTGSAGVGKSALVDAFLESLDGSGAALPARVGRASCVAHHGALEPYMPVLEALERLVRGPAAAQMIDLLRRTAPTWLVQMPWLAAADVARLRRNLWGVRPERMLREFAVFTEALTTERTAVLVLEDIHWSDPSTVDLLALLGQRREPARLLIVGTYRPAELVVREHPLATAVRTLGMHRHCLEVPLHDLNAEDVDAYLVARFPGGQFPPELARLLYQHTDGHPLFLVAVIEYMLSRGWILDTVPGWALSVSPDDLELGVPEDARRLIETEIEGLQPADRELLELASVNGVQFAPQAIAAALACDTADVEIRCEALARGDRFLRVAGTAEWPDDRVARRYAFSHELHRQTVYDAIPEAQRRRLHRRTGEALETAYGERAPEIAAALAAHFERGGDYARTIGYLAGAAAQARQRFANRQAAGFLERAIALSARLPDPGECDRRALECRLALMPVLNDLHGFASEAVLENCKRAEEICQRVGSPEQQFQIVYALCHIYEMRADTVLAGEAEHQLDRLAQRLGKAEYRLLADTVLIRSAMHAGRFAEACDLADARLPPRAEENAPFAFGVDPVIAARCHHAHALWFLGQPARARTTMHSCRATAEASGSVLTLVAVLTHMGILELFCRSAQAVGDLAERATAISAEQGFVQWNAMASALRGWAWVQQGKTADGVREVERARAALGTTGARLFSTHILAFAAEAHLRAGDLPVGLAAVEQALAVAEGTLDRSYWPELWRLKGELLLAAGSPGQRAVRARGARAATQVGAWDETERCLLRAVELARETSAKSLELRATTSLARAWHLHGRTAEARTALAGIIAWFGNESVSPDLSDARAVVDQLSPRRPMRETARAGSAPMRR